MSSFLAHSLVGVSLGNQVQYKNKYETIWISLFFIVLASSPDIDYLICYLRGESFSIRYTHSIAYVFLIGLLALLFRNLFFKKSLASVSLVLFFIAPASHLFLDFMVGVYGNPYLFPFTSTVFTAPFGVLPSAGRIEFSNYYFWRNMFLELLIFLPIMGILVPKIRAYIFHHRFLMFILILLFLGGLLMGFSLERE